MAANGPKQLRREIPEGHGSMKDTRHLPVDGFPELSLKLGFDPAAFMPEPSAGSPVQERSRQTWLHLRPQCLCCSNPQQPSHTPGIRL